MNENRIDQIDEEILDHIEADIMGAKKEEVDMCDNPRYQDFMLEYVFNNYEKTIRDRDVEFLENYIKDRIREVKAGLL